REAEVGQYLAQLGRLPSVVLLRVLAAEEVAVPVIAGQLLLPLVGLRELLERSFPERHLGRAQSFRPYGALRRVEDVVHALFFPRRHTGESSGHARGRADGNDSYRAGLKL